MTIKTILNRRLDAAASLRAQGQYSQAHDELTSLAADPDSALLGHTTLLGLPRRLHSAFLKLAKTQRDAIQTIGYQYHLVPATHVLNQYAAFTLEERRAITQANRQPIPHVIHQIWIGSNTAPVGTEAWREYAKHHGYDYRLWREDSLESLGVNDDPMYRYMLDKGDLPGAVDVARYKILHKFGGVYLDCDWYPVRHDISFNDVLPMTGLTAMPEDIPRHTGKGCTLLANSFIAAPANHPVFTRLSAAIPQVTAELPKAPAWWSTGPLLFTLMSRGGSVTLADADLVAGKLPQDTSIEAVKDWCANKRLTDSGLLLAWRSWAR